MHWDRGWQEKLPALWPEFVKTYLTSFFSETDVGQLVTNLGPQSSAVQMGWQEMGHHIHTSVLEGGDM